MDKQEIAEALDTIQNEQAEHRRLTKTRVRITNSALAYAARMLGYTADMDEKQRDKMWRMASGMMAHIVNPDKKKAPKGTEELASDLRMIGMARKCHEAAAEFEAVEKDTKKRMRNAFKELPIAAWIDGIKGISYEGASFIQGEVGNFWDYDTASKVWKRMGMAVNTDGTRQRKARGVDGIEQQYSPYRRSVMWNFGSSMIKANGSYRHFYDERKEYEMARDIPRGHAHNRAQRYMEKKFLKHFWWEWRKLNPDISKAAIMVDDAAHAHEDELRVLEDAIG